MSRYRVDGLYEDSKARESALRGIHYTQTNPPWGVGGTPGFDPDGVYTQKKYMTVSVVTNPAAGETIVVGGKTLTFRLTPLVATDVKIGALAINGDLTAPVATGWAVPATWTYNATTHKLIHIPGTHAGDPYLGPDDTTIITPTLDNIDPVFQNTWKAVAGRSYVITFTVANYVAGQITPKVGNVLGTPILANGVFAETIVATGDGYLSFVPNAAFNGSVSVISVVDGVTNYKAETAQNIISAVNYYTQATGGTECTAYALGSATLILLVANVIGASPTFTADGAKIIQDIAWTNTIAQNKLDNVSYFKIDQTTDKDAIPTVLVERNAGTDKNFLY